MRAKAAVIIILASFYSAFASPAAAQFEALQFAICKKITADADRLKCFDTIGSKADRAETPKAPATWSLIEDKSPVDDSPQVQATLAGAGGNILAVRCNEHRTEAIFIPKSFFFASGIAQVLMRLNDLPATTSAWNVSTNNTAMFAPTAMEFIRLLPDGGKLFLRAIGYQGRQVDETFNLDDISRVREKIAQACHWPTPKSARLPSRP